MGERSATSLRDSTEALLRGWDAHERGQGRNAVVDFDCYPDGPVSKVTSRIQVLEELTELLEEARLVDADWLISRIRADLAYVRALLGERRPLAAYLLETQGSQAEPWADEYLERRRLEAVDALDRLGVSWGRSTLNELEESEGSLTLGETAVEIQAEADRFEPAVRALVGADAEFSLRVEEVDVDDYWAYWMDGTGDAVRLRINRRTARFTKVRARQLALHEIHGHALQGASYHQRALTDEVPWVRILSVHAPHQILLEGLAQSLPHFVAPDDGPLIARTKLTLYQALVRAQVHLMINDDQPVTDCIGYLREAMPFASDQAIANMLNDRSVSPLLRSYLWSYGAGMDWFVNLAEASPETSRTVMRAAYRDPLTPSHLEHLWPGPTP